VTEQLPLSAPPAKTAKAEKITAAHVRVALRDRFPTREYALLFEVGSGTGIEARRHADAVVMGLWPSRGLEVEGIEIKVSRSDWQTELKKPEKAEAVARFCNRWWIVAAAGIVKPEELPVTWGLMELAEPGSSLRVRVPAPAKPADPLDRTFVAAMLRRASEADLAEVNLRVQEHTAAIQKAADERIECEVERRCGKLREAQEQVRKLEAELGFSLTGWHAPEGLAAKIKFAQALGIGNSYGGALRGLADETKRLHAALEQFVSEHAPAGVAE
jgi:hypothetical protein